MPLISVALQLRGPLDIRSLGAVAGGADVTAYIVAALARADGVLIPAGEWHVSAFSVPAGKTIVTAGQSTVIQQIAGQPTGTRPITIAGSNVTLGSLTIKGNIDTDVDEQNHAIFVRGASEVRNVTIGDIWGEDIRGDLVYVGGLASAPVYDVTIGALVGDNILRNILSVTGGERITVASVVPGTTKRVGYAIWDVEPNANSQLCDEIYIGYAKGRQCGIAGGPTYPVGYVEVEFADLNEDFQINSDPPYEFFTGLQHQAFFVRNFQTAVLRRLKVENHNYAALRQPTATGDYTAALLQIDLIELSDCSLSDPTYPYYIVGGWPYLERMEINSGSVDLWAAGRRFVGLMFEGSLFVSDLTCNGTVSWECTGETLEGVTVTSTYDAYVCGGSVGATPGATFIDCTISFDPGVGRLTSHNGNTIGQSTVTVGNFVLPNGCTAQVTDSTINGIYIASGVLEG